MIKKTVRITPQLEQKILEIQAYQQANGYKGTQTSIIEDSIVKWHKQLELEGVIFPPVRGKNGVC